MANESEHWVLESMYPVTDCTRGKGLETDCNYDVYGHRVLLSTHACVTKLCIQLVRPDRNL
eukprot:6212577-Pleurochrysis_carterae.AAC.1